MNLVNPQLVSYLSSRGCSITGAEDDLDPRCPQRLNSRGCITMQWIPQTQHG